MHYVYHLRSTRFPDRSTRSRSDTFYHLCLFRCNPWTRIPSLSLSLMAACDHNAHIGER
jgi:hypothetical protein